MPRFSYAVLFSAAALGLVAFAIRMQTQAQVATPAVAPAAAAADPAPPVGPAGQEPPPPGDPSRARKNPDATFHAAPKPLAAGARTTDWPSFLGPAHNLVVPETKILDAWPAGGPRP